MDWSDSRALRRIIGANVRRLRTARGLTQEQLAELIDSDQPYVSEIEGGLVNLTADILQSLALALGVTPRELCDERRASGVS
jgi:transcriptional regulator with XRE-family HTH domain